MSEASALLRMLEPVVRPGNLPGPMHNRVTGDQPIETKQFETLLEEASSMNRAESAGKVSPASGTDGGQEVERPDMGWLGRLAQVDAVENASLRELIDRRGGRIASTNNPVPPT